VSVHLQRDDATSIPHGQRHVTGSNVSATRKSFQHDQFKRPRFCPNRTHAAGAGEVIRGSAFITCPSCRTVTSCVGRWYPVRRYLVIDIVRKFARFRKSVAEGGTMRFGAIGLGPQIFRSQPRSRGDRRTCSDCRKTCPAQPPLPSAPLIVGKRSPQIICCKSVAPLVAGPEKPPDDVAQPLWPSLTYHYRVPSKGRPQIGRASPNAEETAASP
jgi:hypothetical protein